MSQPQSFAKATLILAGARTLNYPLTFIQFTYFLYVFGSSRITDALIIGQTVPFLLADLFNRGLTNLFQSVFTHSREKMSEEEAWKFTSALALFILLTAIILMGIVFALAPFIVRLFAPGFTSENQQLSANLLRYLSVFIVLAGVKSIPLCTYYAYRHFTVPAVTSLFLSVSIISAIFLLKDLLGIYSVVLGNIVGSVVQVIVLFCFLNKGEQRLQFTLRFWHSDVMSLGKLLGPRLLTIVMTKLNLMVDRGFASLLGPAFLSALSYGNRICAIPREFVLAVFGPIMVPTLANDVARGDLQEFKNKITQYIGIISFAIVPIIVFFLVLGDLLVYVIFQRGAFTSFGVPLTSVALRFYSLALLPAVIGMVLRAGFLALKDTVVPFKVGIVAICLKVAFNYALVGLFSIQGLALATALVYSISAFSLALLLQRKVGQMELKKIQVEIAKKLLAGMSMAIAIWCLTSQSISFNLGNVLHFKPFQLLTATILGGLVYYLTCRALKIREAALAMSQLRKIILRRKPSSGVWTVDL